MTRHSLRWRLSLAAAGLVALALALAGAGFLTIFDRALDTRATAELDRNVKFLAGQVALSPDGTLSLAKEPSDPRFETPYSGFYWQIVAAGTELRSRSLWDKSLDRAAFGAGEQPFRRLDLAGPDGGRLLVVVRSVSIGEGPRQTIVSIAAANDRRALAESRSYFAGLLVPSLVGLGLVLAAAMWIFVQRALAPFEALRTDLRAIHEGRRTLLPTHFPDEVKPLISDLNHLITAQERALSRAKTQAGDLAHGLKTPLAVLAALARGTAVERPDVASEVEEQVGAMRLQVERSLVRARIAAARNLRRRACGAEPVAMQLVAALRRLPDADSLSWEVRLPASLTLPIDAGDLTEMLGNLLDNARKWAHRRIVVTALEGSSEVGLVVEDDGPGMSEEAMSRTGRGMRWDETKPGSGFGIAISSDIAEETDGGITMGRSKLGGLRVELVWKKPPSQVLA